MYKYTEYKDLIGKTLADIKNVDNQELILTCQTGEVYKFFHEQDCCESVEIEDIAGDLNDLIGEPILLCEEAKHENENPLCVAEKEYQDSFTWTFYKISTINGSVTIRWYGESNGYYSESVNFIKVGDDDGD